MPKSTSSRLSAIDALWLDWVERKAPGALRRWGDARLYGTDYDACKAERAALRREFRRIHDRSR